MMDISQMIVFCLEGRGAMTTKDYFVQTEDVNLLMEVQNKTLGQCIISELVAERKRLGLTQQDIADRTGMKAPNVTRVESCKFTPSLDVLERYAMAVGKKLIFELVDLEYGSDDDR